MLRIDLNDRKLFGNDAGEDEDLEVLNSYYIDHPDFKDFLVKTSDYQLLVLVKVWVNRHCYLG